MHYRKLCDKLRYKRREKFFSFKTLFSKNENEAEIGFTFTNVPRKYIVRTFLGSNRQKLRTFSSFSASA